MARLNINPTRMELKKLKARLATAVRGHKLLKDKSDEMIRRFTIILREDKALRDEVEKELLTTLKQFSVARSVTPYGISAGTFLRRPFNGFPQDAELSTFQKALLNCNDAEDLYAVLEKFGCFSTKKIAAKSHIMVSEIPFGGTEPKPVRYANFDVE